MKKIIALPIVFLISFIMFFIIKLPAAIALDLAKPHLPKEIKIGQAIGTIWQGKIMQVAYKDEQLKNVRWDIAGWQLFTGKLTATVKVGNPRDRSTISGNADINYGLFNHVIKVTNARLRSSVERIMKQVQLPLPVTGKGYVVLDIDDYTSGIPYCESLKGDVSSANIDVQGLNGWFNVGSLDANISCKSGDIALQVDANNKLGLDADIRLKSNFGFSVSGYVKPDASLPKDVHDAVKFLGRADNQGRYRLNF